MRENGLPTVAAWFSLWFASVGASLTLVTVTANGKVVICNQEIPGITGGALDSKEEAPGPLLLQGDHGPIEFRRVRVVAAK